MKYQDPEIKQDKIKNFCENQLEEISKPYNECEKEVEQCKDEYTKFAVHFCEDILISESPKVLQEIANFLKKVIEAQDKF